MYENIKTDFKTNEILKGQVRMWHEGKSLETYIFESEQIGLHKGEYQKASKTAKKLKAKGMSLDFIQDVTSLSIDEIENLV